ncbi:hypothetical protein BH23GEM6_BH23GEM6_18100 [soil metagenome]
MEVVGPSGVGKSSIVRAAVTHGYGTFIAPDVRHELKRFEVFQAAIRTAIPFAAQFSNIPSRPLYRYAMMIQLHGHNQVVRTLCDQPLVVVFDQGPIYLLSILQRALSSTGADSRRFIEYWNRTLDLWAQQLQHLIVLEAPGDLLFDRIQRRGTPHPMLAKPKSSAEAFFSRGRGSRDQILSALQTRNPSLDIVSMQVGDQTVEETGKRVWEIGERSLKEAIGRSA